MNNVMTLNKSKDTYIQVRIRDDLADTRINSPCPMCVLNRFYSLALLRFDITFAVTVFA